MLDISLSKMPKPYSDDLRWRIVWQKIFYNRSSIRIARDLFMSPRTVDRIFNLFINTGNVTSLQKFGRPKGTTTLHQHEELVICEMVLRCPAIHLKEIAREIENKTGTRFSIQSFTSTRFCPKKGNNL